MKITAELIDRVSDLSRLSLPPEEREAMAAGLEQIVNYMAMLEALDTASLELTSHSSPVHSAFREDASLTPKDPEACLQSRARLLENAPASDGETFLVPVTVE